MQPAGRAVARDLADHGVGELVRQKAVQRRRDPRVRVDADPDLSVEDARHPVGDRDERKIVAAGVEHDDLGRSERGAEQQGLRFVAVGEARGRALGHRRRDHRVVVDREVLRLEKLLPAGDRELLPRAREAPQDRGIVPAQPLELLPGEHRILRPIQRVVHVSEGAVDLGRRLGGPPLGELQVEVRERVVLRAHVRERDVGEDEPVGLVPAVGLLEQLDGPSDLSLLEIGLADPAEIAGELLRRRRARRHGSGAPAQQRQLLLQIGRRPVRRRRGDGSKEKGTQKQGRRERHAKGYRIRKGAVAYPAFPLAESSRKTRRA